VRREGTQQKRPKGEVKRDISRHYFLFQTTNHILTGGRGMNNKRIQLLLTGVTAWISVLLMITSTYGANIVIGGNYTDIGTIIFVSPKPGDLPTTAGTALRNTLNAIIDNSPTNPHLIKVGPGIYDLGTSPLQMKQYVDIEGSGENATKLTGAVTNSLLPPAGTINGASNAEPRFLTVENTGVGLYTAALLNSYASPSILHVTVKASGGTTSNQGVFNFYSSPVMTNVTASASGGTFSYGVRNYAASPVMTNVTASGSGGTVSCGVYSYSSGSVKINHSVLRGSSYTIVNDTGVTTMVANTQLEGGAVSNGGTLTCVGAYDGNYVALTTSCQ
jgi:hypothetical protein